MIKLKFQFFLVVLFASIFSCRHLIKNESNSSKIAAYIDTIPIEINYVDNKIRQELFDELNRIYFIRKIALQDIIKEKLLSYEASRKNISITILLDSVYQAGRNEYKLQKYISQNQYEKGIPVFERSLIYYDINTKKGNEKLINRFNDYLLRAFIDSLKIKYKTKILLKPPDSPYFEFNNLLIHYKNFDKSKTNFILISDFECEKCREISQMIDSLYDKYKGQINFGFSNFGSYPTLSAIASESAAKQNKFWEMHDSLYALSVLPDTSDIFRIAKNIGINFVEFKKDFFDKTVEDRIRHNLMKIINSGIYATPTIIINNKVVFNSSSKDEIENLINKSISNKNRFIR